MRKRFLGIATVVAALASMLIATTPASAAAGWTASPGGAAQGNAGQTILRARQPGSTGAGLTMTCQSSQATLNIATSTPDSHIADINGMTFANCVLGGLISFTVTATTPWELHGLSYAAPVVNGEIRNIAARLTGLSCRADVAGTVSGTFNNNTDTLTTNGAVYSLTVTNVDAVQNCFGLIRTGYEAAFQGSYVVNPGQTVLPQ
jgi:hypothetical protein